VSSAPRSGGDLEGDKNGVHFGVEPPVLDVEVGQARPCDE